MNNIKKIGEYKNGNYTTIIYDDGTRIRKTEDDYFESEFPDSIDLNISNKCLNRCAFCYARHTEEGDMADLSQSYLYTMHPFTEIAINLNTNFYQQPGLYKFLIKQKENNVIVNGTINIRDLRVEHFNIRQLVYTGLLNGIGISVAGEIIDEIDIELIKSIPNAVVHIVNKVVTLETLERLMEHPELKILILGYKNLGRGSEINPLKYGGVLLNFYIERMHEIFQIVSYDNLALEQLVPQKYLLQEEFETCFQGDEGAHSFYINAVDNTYALSSNTEKTHKIQKGDTIKDIFKKIQNDRNI